MKIFDYFGDVYDIWMIRNKKIDPILFKLKKKKNRWLNNVISFEPESIGSTPHDLV